MLIGTKTLSGLMGLCVGDALGVLVEFTSRTERVKSPVISMLGYGTWDVPAGTWSTDTTAAITGGLAGIYYGVENIPRQWMNQIARKQDIINLATRFEAAVYA